MDGTKVLSLTVSARVHPTAQRSRLAASSSIPWSQSCLSLPEVLAANKAYAESFGEKSELALPPARGFAILTCMDARLDPAKYAGLSGARTSSATRAVGPATMRSVHS